MPGIKKLMVAIVGETGMIEEFVSPRAAAKLARKYQIEQKFLDFAADVVKETQSQELTGDVTELLIAVVGKDEVIKDFVTPKAAAKLVEQCQKEQVFLDFAEKVNQQAKKLASRMATTSQLPLIWHKEAITAQPGEGDNGTVESME